MGNKQYGFVYNGIETIIYEIGEKDYQMLEEYADEIFPSLRAAKTALIRHLKKTLQEYEDRIEEIEQLNVSDLQPS